MNDGQEQLRAWAAGCLGLPGSPAWQPLAGDASDRQYFRVGSGGRSWVASQTPDLEANRHFAAVQGWLAGNGVRVPALLHVDLGRGFTVQEDLGDALLLGALDDDTADAHYGRALALLLRLQALAPDSAGSSCAETPAPEGAGSSRVASSASDSTGFGHVANPTPNSANPIPNYDRATLAEECARFPRWFCAGLLQREPSGAARKVIDESCNLLINTMLEQPQVFVHRDFHSRNLMLLPNDELALLDFQDARWGPLCYDLVSLLRDCYIRWPRARVRGWVLDYRRALLDAGRAAGADDAEFLRWFDWTGLQRHLKVLGNFARLSLRDGKPRYLNDIPLVLDYCLDVTSRHDEFAALHDLFQREWLPRVEGALHDEQRRCGGRP